MQEAAGEDTSVVVDEDSVEDEPFDLVVEGQAVPPDFRAAYERESPIVVQFYEQGGMSFYPRGLGVDSAVDKSIKQLENQYPDVEFFSYDIDDPGIAEGGSALERGQYGTLATQLGVNLTPYVAMLAPREKGYVYESVFVGYVTEPVLTQALSDLANIQTKGSDKEAKLVLQQVETVAEHGALRSVTIGNEGDSAVDLGGYTLAVVEPSTGEAVPGTRSLTIHGDPMAEPGKPISLGRAPDIEDAEGDQVDGTFGGGALILEPGDQVALVDPDGAVSATFTL